MGIQAAINTEFLRRGLLPMDGHCACDRCGETELDRDDIFTVQPHEQIARRAAKHGTHFCAQCIDLMYLGAEDAANPNMRKEAAKPICRHHVEHERVYDRVRDVFHNNWCPHCNGYGQSAQEQSA